MTKQTQKFNGIPLKVGSKQVTYRKWKGKDKKDFINALKDPDTKDIELMDILVYNCLLEQDVILSPDEYQYVLSHIRASSLGNSAKYKFYCPNCTETFEAEYKITELLKPEFSEGNEITVNSDGNETKIILGPVKNKEIYIELIKENELYELLLRIEEFNGDSSFTLDELIDYFDDLDVDVLQGVLAQYNVIKFKINDVETAVCSHCQHSENYSFDEIPEFFPTEWFDDAVLIETIKNQAIKSKNKSKSE